MQQINTCEIILDTLLEIREQQNLSHQVLRAVLDKYGYLEKRDRAYITRVVTGTLEREITLDYVLNLYSRTPVKKMKPLIRILMRSAVYQILYLDGVPCSAVVNSCVNLAGKRGFKGLKAYVNGVLRSVVRSRGEISWPVIDREAGAVQANVRAMSVLYSMPEWIVEKWLVRFGTALTERMLASFLEPNTTTIRVNTSRISPEDLSERLKKQGVTVTANPYVKSAFRITGYDRLTSIPEFTDGLFQVQDVGSILIGILTGAKAGKRCLDVCAAPGGKSLHMADLGGNVTSCDLSIHKTDLIRENVSRNQCSNIQVLEQDACSFRPEWEGTYDIVLADLPCSGLGVLGRKADLRYRITPEEQAELAKLQRTMLDNVKRYVKPGGTLIYSTCTINPGENEENVKYLLKQGEFVPVDLQDRLPEALIRDIQTAGYTQDLAGGTLQMLSGVYDCDGMFAAVLRRK